MTKVKVPYNRRLFDAVYDIAFAIYPNPRDSHLREKVVNAFFIVIEESS